MTDGSAAAGWYPSEGRLRWWDGSAWTQHTAPLPLQTAPVQQPATAPWQPGSRTWLDDAPGWLSGGGATSPPAEQPTPAPAPPAAPELVPTQPPAAASTETGDDVLDHLERLGALRSAGVLTQEEFDAKKAELLRRL